MSGAGPISPAFVVYTNPIAGKRGAFSARPYAASTGFHLDDGAVVKRTDDKDCKDSSFTDVQSTLPFGEVQFYHTTGRMAEVREALRRIIQGRMPLDEVEMIVPDEEYTLAISTMCLWSFLFLRRRATCDYIRNGKSRPFPLNWLESGYQVRPLVSSQN